mmetsp:Transcript_14214/g.46390  ORF Transcript_14214/g.46390 Transcript_14214/m.46390 type:complete len:423 (+) Transcript_14214:38-1306(+)
MSSTLPKIGICGGGVVGGGVYSILTKAKYDVVKICVRDLTKPREWAGKGVTFVDSWEAVVKDDGIDVIVEVMGGVGAAKDCVYEALRRGKHVVTANKALLASKMDEILELRGCSSSFLGFEAAVCGGIPIIATLQQHMVLDEIQSVRGIMNGTTNFMLSKMEAEGADYSDVLAEAQALGFAEADPTADVEGHDVQAKIAILAKLAFGMTVPPEKVPCVGISAVEAVDFEYANLLKSTIRLLGTAARAPGSSEVAVFVYPHIVKRDHPAGFASALGPTNAVSILSEQVGIASLVGPGAGRFPTARSVVADVVRACKIGSSSAVESPFPPLDPSLSLAADFESPFYVRISAEDQLGIIKDIGAAAEKHKVSINAVLQNPIKDPKDIAFVVTTDKVKFSAITLFANDVAQLPFAKHPPLVLAILE